MEPYAPIPGAGPFAASMDLLAALVAGLQAPGADGLTACEVEELLAGRGARCCGSCCRITWTCGRRGNRRLRESTALPRWGQTGSRGAGWRPATPGCWPRCSARCG